MDVSGSLSRKSVRAGDGRRLRAFAVCSIGRLEIAYLHFRFIWMGRGHTNCHLNL